MGWLKPHNKQKVYQVLFYTHLQLVNDERCKQRSRKTNTMPKTCHNTHRMNECNEILFMLMANANIMVSGTTSGERQLAIVYDGDAGK